MRNFGSWGVWLLATLQLGCSGCSGSTQQTHGEVVSTPELRNGTAASRRPGANDRQTDEGARISQERAHRFHPVQHPPYTHPGYEPVPPDRLPRMVQREVCFTGSPLPYTYSPHSGIGTKGRAGAAAPKANRARGVPERAGTADNAAQPSPPMAASPEPGHHASEGKVAQKRAPHPANPAKSESRQPQYPSAESAAGALSEYSSPSDRSRHELYHDWGASIYLSNDDTMSLSSAQRVIYAIDKQLPIPPEHIRPHEFLNYFSFRSAPVASGSDFSVLPSIAAKPGSAGEYTLGLVVAGRDVTRETRRNVGLTLVVDRSGSMASEGRMNYLKQGLQRMTSELKHGDLINMVLFDDSVCTPLENFVVGRDSMAVLQRVIARLQPRGSTNLHSGLKRGYELANDSYQDAFTNRVLLISDALANTGVTDPQLLSLVSESYDKRRVRLSGVGVGSDFNDALLDRLTEKGKGAYVFLGSEAEVDAVFGIRFTSLVETIANDVHFRLHLPPSLRMNTFYGEESSAVKSDVQAVHYFAGTSQLFLSDVVALQGALARNDEIMLTIEYENPETGGKQVEEYAFPLGDLERDPRDVEKGRLLMSFIDGVRDIELAAVESASRGRHAEHAATQCSVGRDALARQAAAVPDDREVTRVLALWETYCQRFPRPRYQPPQVVPRQYAPEQPQPAPYRRPAPRGSDVWPSAMR